MDALSIVQEFFPNVTKVKDATEDLFVDVTKKDSNSALVRNHKACAMAVACKHKTKADGVIVSVATTYVIKDKTATRYKVSESVAREVVSFDRNGGFAEGSYHLRPPRSNEKLGEQKSGTGIKTGTGRKLVRKHQTTGIRTVLGSKIKGDI